MLKLVNVFSRSSHSEDVKSHNSATTSRPSAVANPCALPRIILFAPTLVILSTSSLTIPKRPLFEALWNASSILPASYARSSSDILTWPLAEAPWSLSSNFLLSYPSTNLVTPLQTYPSITPINFSLAQFSRIDQADCVEPLDRAGSLVDKYDCKQHFDRLASVDYSNNIHASSYDTNTNNATLMPSCAV